MGPAEVEEGSNNSGAVKVRQAAVPAVETETKRGALFTTEGSEVDGAHENPRTGDESSSSDALAGHLKEENEGLEDAVDEIPCEDITARESFHVHVRRD
jgi:hypothetical protein